MPIFLMAINLRALRDLAEIDILRPWKKKKALSSLNSQKEKNRRGSLQWPERPSYVKIWYYHRCKSKTQRQMDGKRGQGREGRERENQTRQDKIILLSCLRTITEWTYIQFQLLQSHWYAETLSSNGQSFKNKDGQFLYDGFVTAS